MKTYKVLSLLLHYPEAAWLEELPQMRHVLREERRQNRRAAERLEVLLQWLAGPLLSLQMQYVETFDRQPGHALYLYEHLYGESRLRGTAMLDLLSRYQDRGLALQGNELPDYLPVFLEFLSTQPPRAARRELRRVGSAVRLLEERLTAASSPYAAVFMVLARLTPAGLASAVPAPRPMEQLLAQQGRSADGREPLLIPEVRVPFSSIRRRVGDGDTP